VVSHFCYLSNLSFPAQQTKITQRSPQWNWGSARGTGHDCAAICRRQYSTKESRRQLIDNLLEPAEDSNKRQPENFEEVKLILGLAFQNGRWDGSDGGAGGYGEVLQYMAGAQRDEEGSEDECAMRFVRDMQDRFEFIADVSSMELREMRCILDGDAGKDMDCVRRKCSGLVLDQMGFVKKGL